MAAQRLSIVLTGKTRLFCDDAEIPLAGSKTRALLGVLALHAPTPLPRDRIVALLWSEQSQTSARSALRQALHRLRLDLGPHADRLLTGTAEDLAINRAQVDIDALAALEDALAGRLPTLLQTTPQAFFDLMAGLDFVDPNFSNYLQVRRNMMHEAAVDGLGRALARHVPPDSDGAAIARLLIRMEPTQEAACRYMMQVHHAQGSVAGVLSVYEKLWQVLDEDFDALPSDETQRLIVAIKQATPPTPAASLPGFIPAPRQDDILVPAVTAPGFAEPVASFPRATLRVRRPPILRIERFDSAGLPEPQMLRVMGLRHDFVAALCRFREWRVLDLADAPTSVDDADCRVFGVAGTAIAGPEGTELILTFRDAQNGEVIWSERVTLDADSWGRMQRRMVRRIAIASSLHLSANRLARLGAAPGMDLSAHDAWLLGQALMSRWRPDSEDRAEALFRQIIAEHPDFAPAYVGLAQVLNARHHMRPGVFRSRQMQAEALDHSLRAVTLDPLDAKAQLTLAWSFALNDSYDNAVQTFRVACDLNENDPWTLVSSSLGFAYCGEVATGARLGEQMRDLGLGVTPLHWAYNAGVLFMARDYGEAAMAAARASGATYYIAAWQAAALAHTGQTAQAQSLLARFFAQMQAMWTGPQPASDRAITEWLLHCYPIRDDADWAQLRDGLAIAGAPVPDTRPGPIP